MGSTFPAGRAGLTVEPLLARGTHGVRIVATTVADGDAARDVDLARPMLVLLGNEGAGCRRERVSAQTAR